MWTLEDLQFAADEIYKDHKLGDITMIVGNHATRQEWENQQKADRARSRYSGDLIPFLASKGLPDNWFMFVYGSLMFGVDPIAHTVARISPVWLLNPEGY